MPVEGEASDTLFFGVSASAHLGLGGHVKIGWDANEFMSILNE